MAVAVPTSKDWLEIERYLDAKEKQLMTTNGFTMPDGHLSGYQYKPRLKIVDKHPWDVRPTPVSLPVCSSTNWVHKELKFEIGNGIAYLTLNRPEANNAFDEKLSQALSDAAFELQKRTDLRVVVLRAVGKMFCAGAGPQAFIAREGLSDVTMKKADNGFMRFLYFFQCLPQFTVALVQGSCLGSGLGLLAACDYVMAVGTARFMSSDVKIGTSPAAIGPFISAKAGPTNAKRILCLGENLSAEKVLEMGLIQEVVEEEPDFPGLLAELCESITAAAPLAMGRTKKLVLNVAQQPFTPALLDYTAAELASVRVAEEAAKGAEAMEARSKPHWAENKVTPFS